MTRWDLLWMDEQGERFYSSTFGAWLEGVYEYQLANPGQRDGQAAFNFLHAIKPDIANQIRTTPLDPFYQDDRLDAFFRKVEELWQ